MIRPVNITDVKEKNKLQLEVLPYDEQSQEDVSFDWSVQSFSEDKMTLHLVFDKPYVIRRENIFVLTVTDVALFIRQKDGYAINEGTKLEQDLVVQIDKSLGETIDGLGNSMGYVGKGQLIILFLLSSFLSYGLSKIFGQVRSMSLVTHMMMMQLNFSAVTNTFFSKLFEYVTYDIVPTEQIYSTLFNWENNAFTD